MNSKNWILLSLSLATACDQSASIGERNDSGADVDGGATDVTSDDGGNDSAIVLPRDSGARDGGGRQELRVFVTSLTYRGNLMMAANATDGLTGGDTLCQQHADAAELGGRWRAWLSSGRAEDDPSVNDAIERIIGDGPWVAMDGAVLFPNRASLTTGPRAGLSLDELSRSIEGDGYYWTGTGVGGRATTSATCEGFRSSGVSAGTFGTASVTDSRWTDSGRTSCGEEKHLLCFEQ